MKQQIIAITAVDEPDLDPALGDIKWFSLLIPVIIAAGIIYICAVCVRKDCGLCKEGPISWKCVVLFRSKFLFTSASSVPPPPPKATPGPIIHAAALLCPVHDKTPYR